MNVPFRKKRGGRARKEYPEEIGTSSIDEEYARTLDTKQRRVEYIADLMSMCQYVTRKTARELAGVWGLQIATVEHEYVAHAATVLRTSLGTFDTLRNRCLATMDRINSECLAMGRDEEVDALAAAKFYEVSLQATMGMLAFTSSEFDHELALSKERREAEKHKRDMGASDTRTITLVVEEARIDGNGTDGERTAHQADEAADARVSNA